MPPPGEPFTLIAFKDTSAPVGAATADHYAVVRAHSKLSEDKSENWNGGMIEDPVLSFTKVGQTDKKCWKEILTDTTNASSPVRPIVVWGDREEKNDNGQVIAHAGELRYPTKQEFKTVDAKWDADNVGNVSFAPVQAQLRWLISVNGFGARVISDHGWMITLDGYALNTFSDLVGGGGPNNSSRDEVYAKITNDDPNDITEYETEVECAKENSPSQVRLVVEVGNTGNYKNEIELSYDDDPIQTVDWDFGEIQTDNGESNNTVNFKLENLNGDTDSKFKIDGFRFYSSLDPNGDFKDGEAYGNDQSYDKNGWQITSSKTNGEVRSDANRGWVVKRAVTKSGDVNKSILSGFHQSDEQTYEPSGSTIESCTIQMGSSIGPSARIAGNLMQKIYHNNASNENSNSIEWKLEIDKIYQDKGKKANGETNWVELHDGKITVVCKYKPFEYKYKVKTKGIGQNVGERGPGAGGGRKVFSYMAEPLSPYLGEWVKNGGWFQFDIGLVNEAIGRLYPVLTEAKLEADHTAGRGNQSYSTTLRWIGTSVGKGLRYSGSNGGGPILINEGMNNNPPVYQQPSMAIYGPLDENDSHNYSTIEDSGPSVYLSEATTKFYWCGLASKKLSGQHLYMNELTDNFDQERKNGSRDDREKPDGGYYKPLHIKGDYKLTLQYQVHNDTRKFTNIGHPDNDNGLEAISSTHPDTSFTIVLEWKQESARAVMTSSEYNNGE